VFWLDAPLKDLDIVFIQPVLARFPLVNTVLDIVSSGLLTYPQISLAVAETIGYTRIYQQVTIATLKTCQHSNLPGDLTVHGTLLCSPSLTLLSRSQLLYNPKVSLQHHVLQRRFHPPILHIPAYVKHQANIKRPPQPSIRSETVVHTTLFSALEQAPPLLRNHG